MKFAPKLACPLMGLLALASLSQARIDYRVSPSADRNTLFVQISIPVTEKRIAVQMPSWSPGLYVLENYWRNVRAFAAVDQQGRSLVVHHRESDTWEIEARGARTVTVSYQTPVVRGEDRLGMFSSDSKAIHFCGPPTYMYVVGRKLEACQLTVNFPGSDIATGLELAEDGAAPLYRAPNFDTLADCPVTVGTFEKLTYSTHGVLHTIAFRGPAQRTIDKAKALQSCQFITRTHSAFFGAMPFSAYTWHFWTMNFADAAGGVEHASSTDMFLSTKIGPGALRGISHEYFHLWNVKRIRSQNLGPFDYRRLPRAGDLWWLEGVTDYYAMLLPYRYKAWGRAEFLSDVCEQVRDVRANRNRFAVSPFEAGDRTPEAQNMMSSGYKVNYYPTGWLLGMMFDIEVRSNSRGRYSLDDVERSLLAQSPSEHGYMPGAIRATLVHYGGGNLGKLYDTWVMQPGELPVEACLAKAGFAIRKSPDGKRFRITALPHPEPAALALREAWLKQIELPNED